MTYNRLSAIDLKANLGNRVGAIFVAKSVEVRPQKNGGEFLTLVMKDKSIEVDAKIFSVSASTKEEVTPGMVYSAQIDIKPYDKGKDGISCIIYSIEKMSDMKPEMFVDWNTYLNAAASIVGELMALIDGTIYGKIVKDLITRYWNTYAIWPAGKSHHHTELGALLSHTATVAKSAFELGKYYNTVYGENFINLSLLVAGSLLHDIGKVAEYDVNKVTGEATYSLDGTLSSHLVIGVQYIMESAIRQGIDLNSEEIKLLNHMIISHHGRLEYGSPVIPVIPEAFILHYCDALDAGLWRFNKNLSELHSGESSSFWMDGKINVIYKETSKELKKSSDENNTINNQNKNIEI